MHFYRITFLTPQGKQLCETAWARTAREARSLVKGLAHVGRITRACRIQPGPVWGR